MLSHFDAPYVMYSVGVPMGPVTKDAIDSGVGDIRNALQPWLSQGTYFNFADTDVESSSLYPDGVFGRLAEIRAEVDPDGLFRARHTI